MRRLTLAPSGPPQLIHLDWLRPPLHRHRPQRRDLDVALDQAQGVGGQEGRAGARELLHAGGQMGRLPDGRITHVQVAADCAHHHLAAIESYPDVDRDAACLLERV
jgi:hypothetical protein